jgi:hypothetical protein
MSMVKVMRKKRRRRKKRKRKRKRKRKKVKGSRQNIPQSLLSRSSRNIGPSLLCSCSCINEDRRIIIFSKVSFF